MFEVAFYDLATLQALVEASRYLRSDATAHHFRGISTGYANAKARFRHRRQISYISMRYMFGALGGRSHLLGYQWLANICRTKRCISNPRVPFRKPLSGQASRRGLRRRVRSERAHRGSDHRDDFDLGVAVMRLTPRALDCDDHLLSRIDEDELAKHASRRKGT